ncbi:related to serine/threonine-protein kinase [Melanopsichium pennsylvanicum]|uniref:Related to serine/threonine-protein kinase n=2 Tax=Melanopsichium pennsylvanicum TaxID=63383 RepID=A0AAJ4XM92_9BASI|nr:related to serine/threonine-protein kinase [Melanopsichium pennsylvanicum 4]SNX83648.1 related to serine/threonine-protein kinase [Melanopsichium pennsylvanicum]
MLASALHSQAVQGLQHMATAEDAWNPAEDMECDQDEIRVATPSKANVIANSVMTNMTSSQSTHSISSSSSSGDPEPELSQSLGSVSSFDLRTPLKPSLTANHLYEAPSESFNVLGLHKHNAAPAASRPTKNLLAEALAARKSRPTSNPAEAITVQDACLATSARNTMPASSESISPNSQAQMGTRGFSATFQSSPLNRPNKPKLTLPVLAPSAFAHPNFPQTPGGSLFYGARDGAATGTPVSPFLPPTPLVASMMQAEQGKHLGEGNEPSTRDRDAFRASLSPQLSRAPMSLPSTSTPRQSKPVRAPLQRHGSLGMSPLSREFASVSMRGKSKSNEGPSSSGSPIPRRAQELSSGRNPGSPSTLLTPPYSPLTLAKSLPDEASVIAKRRSSSSSSSVSSSSSKKLRPKESLLGGGTDLSRSFSANRLKSSTTRTKAVPKPFHLDKAFLGDNSGLDVNATSPQPLSAPAMKISFADDETEIEFDQRMSPEPMLPAESSSGVAAGSQSNVLPSLNDSSLLSPSSALKAPTMEKSFSAPLPPPQTVSARHLADYTLHPSFSSLYTLGDELGSGGFGFVVAARRKTDSLPVAVKFIFKDKVPAHGWVRDPKLGVIPMEAFVLKVVEHPGVVKFIDLFNDRNFFYLVMELHGTPWQPPAPVAEPSPSSTPVRPTPMQRRTSCDLFECIEQHSRLTEEQARWVFAQVVETVWHLDRIGICHRDIKDENCVVDSDFNVKLIDFGSAVITDVRKPQPYFNRFFGTMTFASPEILQGKPYRAPHAEIWSLGVLLSILLSGQCPFPDPAAAIKGRISRPKGAWSKDALDLLLLCLEVDPERRANIGALRDHPWVVRAWKERAAKLGQTHGVATSSV